MILLSRVLKTDGCCLEGRTEILILSQRLMETNGRCLNHAVLNVELILSVVAHGLFCELTVWNVAIGLRL